MNSQLHQISLWMAAHHRHVRWKPVTKLNSFERIDTLDHVARAVVRLGHALKVEVKFTAPTSDDSRDHIDPKEVLHALSTLQAAVHGAYLSTGLSAAQEVGIYELVNKHLPDGAVAKHEPNFGEAIKKVYDEESKS